VARALPVGGWVTLLGADGANASSAESRHHAGSHGVAVVVVTHDDAAVEAAGCWRWTTAARVVVPASPP